MNRCSSAWCLVQCLLATRKSGAAVAEEGRSDTIRDGNRIKQSEIKYSNRSDAVSLPQQQMTVTR